MIKKTPEEMALLKYKVNRALNIIITILSVVVIIICAFLVSYGKIDKGTAGVIIPLALIVYLVMGVLSNRYEKRKTVMIIYIVLITICALVFFIDLVWMGVNR